MSAPTRVLYVDDSALDRELVRDALEKEGSGFTLIEASSRKAFEERLDGGQFDIVLSDFNILGFEGLQVLDAVRQKAPTTPVVIVTGTGSEEVAVEAMKRGAADYVIKTASHIRRLPHTLLSVLELVRAEQAEARATRERDLLFDRSQDLLGISTFEAVMTQINPAWESTLGWKREELESRAYTELVHPEDLEPTIEWVQRLAEGEPMVSHQNRCLCKNGEYRWLSWNASPWDAEQLIFSTARDVTEQKAADERIERQIRRLAALHDIDKAITASLELDSVLNVLLEHTVAQLGVDAASILLYDENNQLLEYAAGHGFNSTSVRNARLLMSEGYAGKAILSRRVVHVPNLLDEGEEAQFDMDEPSAIVEYYGAPLVARGSLKGVLEIFHPAVLDPDPDWVVFLEMLAEQAAIAIASAQLVDDLRRSNDELALAYGATIEGWSRALDLRDRETEGHTRRVTELTLRLARAMGVSEADLVHVRRGALLHDIGKMGVPDSILLKPGPLSDEEEEQMRKHPQLAHDMLSPIAYLHSALDIPYCHHEKWDGTGYPRGLKGEEIPRAARIFTVVDVWDALRSDRPYRSAWSKQEAMDYMLSQAGQYFDPEAVAAFERLIARDESIEVR